MKLVKKYSIDDSCIICGEGRGGHYFEGTRNDAGYYEIDGWLAIEHLAGCYVWLCPECRIDTLKNRISMMNSMIAILRSEIKE